MAMGWLMGNGFVVIVSPDTFSFNSTIYDERGALVST
jgi:hypothetical protein